MGCSFQAYVRHAAKLHRLEQRFVERKLPGNHIDKRFDGILFDILITCEPDAIFKSSAA